MNDKNKVLLLTATATANAVQDSIAISYGLYLLKNTLNLNEIKCDIVDLELISESQCLKLVTNNDYDVIGMSVTHCNMQNDLDFLHKLKRTMEKAEKKSLFVAGGMSATLNYAAWLSGGFDVVFIGYAEEALLKVCDTYYQEMNSDEYISLLHKTDGIAFIDTDGKIKFNPVKPLHNKDFENKMYFLAMEMEVPYHEYWDFIRRKGIDALSMNNRSYVIENARLYTSSKCLANCGYCCCPAFIPAAQNAKAAPVMLSAEQVYNLVVHHVQKYKARSFSFNDEDFLIGNKAGTSRVLQFCDLVITAKLEGKLPDEIRFSCQTRASNFLVKVPDNHPIVNIELIKKMAEAKFHNVSLGIETFSERLLRTPSVNKPKVKATDYHNVLDAMMEHGLFPTINLIFGIPEETPEEVLSTIEQTMAYVEKPCQISVNTRMSSFPGAPIYNLKNYPTSYKTWQNPENKEVIPISDYFIPKNQIIAHLIEILEKEKWLELENIKRKHQLSDAQIIPRIVIALCTFSVITRHLNQSVLHNIINNKLDDLLIRQLNRCKHGSSEFIDINE